MAVELEVSRMTPDRDETTGKFITSYPPEEFIEALRKADGMASTHELAEAVGSSDRLALDRLAQLAEQGQGPVTRRKVANANLWVLSEDADAEDESEQGGEVSA